ncbi:MAG: polysaccharide biosynthesis tyrosine autokinase [Leptolyngbya sp. SIO1D8]|nr:polysaccharide biosynthesis tyrosine autokinase [Leptolyngbya sp. SIO1D8]
MDIQQYWLILKRRWLPATVVFASVSALTVIALAQQINIYQAKGKIRFTPEDRISALTGLGLTEGEFNPLVDSNNPMTTEMEVIRSEPIIGNTLEQLALRRFEGPSITRKDLLENLQLTNVRGTDILLLTYQDADPQLAAMVINTLMEVYLENHVSENRTEAMAAREFIEQELPGAEARVRRAEAALRRFQEANQVAALEEEKVSVVTATETLRQRVAEAQAALADATEQATAFSQQLGMSPQQAIAVTTLSQSAGVQEILTQYQSVESQLAIERVRFHDASPVVQALLNQKAHLEELLQTRVARTLNGRSIDPNTHFQIGDLQADLAGDLARTDAMRRGLAQQLDTLQEAQTFYNRRLATLPRLEQEQRELLRRLEAAQGSYSLLLERLYEIRIAENQNVGNARILQQAFVEDEPVAPRKLSFLTTGILAALLLSAVTILALETQDKYVKTAKQARNLFELTLLGVIPLHKTTRRSRQGFRFVKEHSEVIVRDEPESAIAEAYRMLQANLKFLDSDREIKTVVVTSSTVGEGKSLISANLAMARAQLGVRVLLIDADMRRPRQHQIWDLDNEGGLSNIIVEHQPLESVVKTPAENLDVLTAGGMPPNQAALLDSQHMARFLQQTTEEYDFVIIDTPAVNIAANVHTLSRLSSGVLLVTRPGVVDMGSALAAKDRLTQFGPQVLGQVINGVVPENEPDSYYYFSSNHAEKTSVNEALSAVTTAQPE